MKPTPDSNRRLLLRGATLALAGAPLFARGAPLVPSLLQSAGATPALRLRHLHTRETLEVAADAVQAHRPGLLAALNRFLRDHYSGMQGTMDPGLLDQLRSLQHLLATDGTIEVISGFRSTETNERLRRRGGGGVATRSLHLQGRALDLRMEGVPLARLRDAALELQAGGVGFYPESNFVHIDTGRARRWG